MSAAAKIFAQCLLRNPLSECLTAWSLVVATLIALALTDSVPWIASNGGGLAALAMLLAPRATLPPHLEPRDYLLPPGRWRPSTSDAFLTTLLILATWGPAQHLWRTLLYQQALQPQSLSLQSWAWIPIFLLAQTLVIALPEEAFFRGYMQTRLSTEPWNRTALRLGPLQITTANLLVSALFALTHLPASPSPMRLATFFPSLLFGALRDRTGSIVAPILVHVACNLFMEITVRAYA
jgi:membrane protease YdiL (CAAX protease family)